MNSDSADLLVVLWRNAPNTTDAKLLSMLVMALAFVDLGFAQAVQDLITVPPGEKNEKLVVLNDYDKLKLEGVTIINKFIRLCSKDQTLNP